MRIVILGASGLIGHKLFQVLDARFGGVVPVLHGARDRFAPFGLFQGESTVEDVEVWDFEAACKTLEALEPDVVLNCAGITKRRPEINDPITAIKVNALWPHHLAHWGKAHGARMIHFSTDCVFDASKGDYTEDDVTTARDAYGQTKALGETRYDHALTIRSSFIGRELAVHSELLDWFLAQGGKTIGGFSDVLYTGVSTAELARIVGDIIEHHPDLGGLYQLSVPEPISKYDLLCLAREAFDVDVTIEPNDTARGRATLLSDRLREAIGFQVPTWPEMMTALAADPTPYPKLS